MAEGWARALKKDVVDAYSGGISPKGVDPRATAAMAEAGVDISGQHSKDINALDHVSFDWVVTLCGHARESCPVFPGSVRRLHAGFDDPPQLAENAKDEEDAMAHYRRVRDEIRSFVESLPESLTDTATKV
ncbi:MAG: arsenate reductase ArsC [Desulfobacterales bacterium]|nr:arsenate reductase ArsC [Desulfobacterales bacterium]